MQNFVTVIEQDSEGWYIGYVPSLHGCHTQAKSLPELYERLTEVIQLCVEDQANDIPRSKFVGVQNLEVPIYA